MIQYPYDVDGTSTRLIESGSGERSFLLLHGVGARADRWVPAIDALAAAGFRVVAVDLPGHGFAAKGPGQDYTVRGGARFVRALIRSLGVDRRRLTIVGTSWGGHIAAMAVTMEPDLAAALVLVGSLGLEPWGDERRRRSASRLVDVSEDGVRAKLGNLVHDRSLVTDAWVREEHLVNSSGGAAEAFEAIAAYVADDLDDDLVVDALAARAASIPIQLIWGSEDRAVPVEVAVAAHGPLPGSELAVLPATAHAPYLEAPTSFVETVVAFVDDPGRQPGGGPHEG